MNIKTATGDTLLRENKVRIGRYLGEKAVFFCVQLLVNKMLKGT